MSYISPGILGLNNVRDDNIRFKYFDSGDKINTTDMNNNIKVIQQYFGFFTHSKMLYGMRTAVPSFSATISSNTFIAATSFNTNVLTKINNSFNQLKTNHGNLTTIPSYRRTMLNSHFTTIPTVVAATTLTASNINNILSNIENNFSLLSYLSQPYIEIFPTPIPTTALILRSEILTQSSTFSFSIPVTYYINTTASTLLYLSPCYYSQNENNDNYDTFGVYILPAPFEEMIPANLIVSTNGDPTQSTSTNLDLSFYNPGEYQFYVYSSTCHTRARTAKFTTFNYTPSMSNKTLIGNIVVTVNSTASLVTRAISSYTADAKKSYTIASIPLREEYNVLL